MDDLIKKSQPVITIWVGVQNFKLSKVDWAYGKFENHCLNWCIKITHYVPKY